MKTMRYISIVCLLLLVVNVHSQTQNRQTTRIGQKVKELEIEIVLKEEVLGDKAEKFVKTEGNFQLRDAPPSGWLNKSGEKVGVIEKNSYLRLLDQKTATSPFSTQEWIKVETLDPDNPKTGWIYVGRKKGEEEHVQMLDAKQAVQILTESSAPELETEVKAILQRKPEVEKDFEQTVQTLKGGRQ